MQVSIYDVDHGGCVVVTTPNGERLMLDCGRNVGRAWSPSEAFRDQRIDALFLLNLDEDHVEDLPELWNAAPIGSIVSNPTVSAGTLDLIKAGCMRAGVRKAHEILSQFGPGVMGWPPEDLGGVNVTWFWNRFGTHHTDTNNLSLAVFVEYGDFCILFGGDLETKGWRTLQTHPAFNSFLARTKVFVASHHGRRNGQCDEIFEHLKPEVILFSDGSKQYVSQETDNWYRTRAAGIPDLDKPEGLLGRPRRYVMTTRRDGTMIINVQANGRYLIQPEAPTPEPSLDGLLSDLSWLGALAPDTPAVPNRMTGPSAFDRLLGTPTPPAPGLLGDLSWLYPDPSPMTGLGGGAHPSYDGGLAPGALMTNALTGRPRRGGFGF